MDTTTGIKKQAYNFFINNPIQYWTGKDPTKMSPSEVAATAVGLYITAAAPYLALSGCDCAGKKESCKNKCCDGINGDDTTPADDDTAPLGDDTIPAGDDTTSADDDTIPVGDDTTTADDDTTHICKEGETQTTYSGPAGTQSVGICKPEIKVCENGAFVITQNQVLPEEEIACNDIDEDCDGIALPGTFGKIGPDIRITTGSGSSVDPSLVWTGSEYGLSWDGTSDGSNEIYFARLSDTGIKIGDDVCVSDDNSSSMHPSLVWNGSEYGLSWNNGLSGDDGIYFARISDTGIKIGANVRVTDNCDPPFGPSLVWTGTEYGVSWVDPNSGNDGIDFTRLSDTGIKIGPDVRISDDNNSDSVSPSLVWTGSEYGVSWYNYYASDNTGIYFARISDTGTKIGADVCVTNASGYSFNPSLAWTGSEYGVSWGNNLNGSIDLYFARLSGTGAKIGSDVRITNYSSASDVPSLVWTGSEYGVSWQDGRNANWDIYFARIGCQ